MGVGIKGVNRYYIWFGSLKAVIQNYQRWQAIQFLDKFLPTFGAYDLHKRPQYQISGSFVIGSCMGDSAYFRT